MLKRLQGERLEAINKARAILDAADEEKRALSAEEREQYDSFDNEISRIDGEIDDQIKDDERRTRLDAWQARNEEAEVRKVPEEQPSGDFQPEDTEQRGTASKEYSDAWWKCMRHSRGVLEPNERRALQVGTDSEGGYLTPDEFWNAELVQALEEANVMRGLGTVIQTSSGSMDIPVVSSHGSAAWTAEEAAFTEGDEAFSVVSLGAFKAASILKVSEELLLDSAFNLSGYLATELGRRIGALEEAAFVDGDGSSKPTGAIDGSTAGVTAAATGAITSDELIDLYHALGRQYRNKGTFLMADATLKAVRKLKDGDDQYLWQPGLQAGEPGRMLGQPVLTSESMKALGAANETVLFGDFSYYYIADRESVVLKRLDELYAANGFVAFRAHRRVDGKVILAEAIQHLVQAAS